MLKKTKLPEKNFVKRHNFLFFALFICFIFFICYSTLSIVRHSHYESYGFDLGINDQTVWRYSKFQIPITTIDPFPDRSKLDAHVEVIYALIAPFYWIWPARRMLLIVSAFVVCSGGLAVYLLAKRRTKGEFISISLMISYLMFYGLQFAIWTDVHSTNFAAAFLAWFLYSLDGKKKTWSIIFFLLAITSKENIALYTLVIALLYLIRRRNKLLLFIVVTSILYLFFIFYIYFPHIVGLPYLYQNHSGLLSNFNPIFLFNTKEKLTTIFYSYLSVGFLPILNPLTLPLIFAHFGTFFVIASDLPGAQGLFGHYRITLDPLFAWATIMTISTFKFLNRKYIAVYILFCALIVQYTLHLPLSYLTKSWFWTASPAVATLDQMISLHLPPDASVVSQNNITPHISHRDKIYTLYPVKKAFGVNSPCGQKECNWFLWHENPQFLIVDTSANWDARHLLIDRPEYIDGLSNLEKAGVVKLEKKIGNTILYKVLKRP